MICSTPAEVVQIPKEWTNREMAGLAVNFGGNCEDRASLTAVSAN